MMDQLSPLQIHGGRRAGAGAKPQLDKQLSEARKLAKALQIAVRAGIDQLTDEYPNLMRLAVDIAKNGDEKMLRYLLDLPLRLVQLEDEAERPISSILNTFKVEIQVQQEKQRERVVEGTIAGHVAEPRPENS